MCVSLKCSSTHSFSGAGNQVELDDLLSPLKKMKSFRSLQKRLVSPSLDLTVCLIDTKYTHMHMYICSMSEGVGVNVSTSTYRHTGTIACCVFVCMRACVCACVRVCMRACVCV